jgi:hypothetical protein
MHVRKIAVKFKMHEVNVSILAILLSTINLVNVKKLQYYCYCIVAGSIDNAIIYIVIAIATYLISVHTVEHAQPLQFV